MKRPRGGHFPHKGDFRHRWPGAPGNAAKADFSAPDDLLFTPPIAPLEFRWPF